jgi:hypothetical protein
LDKKGKKKYEINIFFKTLELKRKIKQAKNTKMQSKLFSKSFKIDLNKNLNKTQNIKIGPKILYLIYK